jgi:3-phosphoshikimate 1-carboxyvinyltransferase
LSKNAEIELSSFKKNSLQADAICTDIYKHLGVETEFKNHSIRLKKTTDIELDFFKELDLTHAPDIAQTIAVTCFGLGIECNLTGLHTLKIKETDRLQALKTEIEKLGGEVAITNSTLHLKPAKKLNANCSIATYNDHRMAMAFAPLSLLVPIAIEDPAVVSKSYPTFWKDYELMTE